MPKLPSGIRRTSTAICAYLKVRTRQVQRSFPLATSIVDVFMWREEMRRQLALQHGSGGGTLARDIGNDPGTLTRAQRRNAEGWLVKWARWFGDRRRVTLTYEELRALTAWKSDGYSPSSLNKLRTDFIAV